MTFTARARTLGGYTGDFAQVWRRAVDSDCPELPREPVVEQEPRVDDRPAPPVPPVTDPGRVEPPAGDPAAKPRVVLAGTRLKRAARGRALTLSLECAPGARCTGSVRLAVGRAKLGRAPLALAAGRRATVTVKLGAAARRALARARGKKVTVTVALAGGATTTAKLRVR